MERIVESGTENRDIAEDKSFAVIKGSLFRSITRQERGARVAQVLQRAAPEQTVPAVGGEMVIEFRDEDIVVKLGGRAENKTCIIQAISRGRIIGHRLTGAKGLIEITGVIGQIEHGRINPEMARIKICLVRRSESRDPAVHVYIAKDALAERR